MPNVRRTYALTGAASGIGYMTGQTIFIDGGADVVLRGRRHLVIGDG